MASNQLTSFESFCLLPSLITCHISLGNYPSGNFTLDADCVAAFNTSLEWLDISNNKIESLHGIEKLNHLTGVSVPAIMLSKFTAPCVKCFARATTRFFALVPYRR